MKYTKNDPRTLFKVYELLTRHTKRCDSLLEPVIESSCLPDMASNYLNIGFRLEVEMKTLKTLCNNFNIVNDNLAVNSYTYKFWFELEEFFKISILNEFHFMKNLLIKTGVRRDGNEEKKSKEYGSYLSKNTIDLV